MVRIIIRALYLITKGALSGKQLKWGWNGAKYVHPHEKILDDDDGGGDENVSFQYS